MQTTSDRTPNDEALLDARIKRLKSLPPDLREELRAHWLNLFRDVGDSLDGDPAGRRAQQLASRWLDLMDRTMGGDPYLMQNPAVYEDLSRWPLSMGMFADRRVWDFIAKALAAREGTALGR